MNVATLPACRQRGIPDFFGGLWNDFFEIFSRPLGRGRAVGGLGVDGWALLAEGLVDLLLRIKVEMPGPVGSAKHRAANHRQ